MTVVACVISRRCTVHATDSLLTVQRGDGTIEPQDWRHPKIVPVEAWSGAMAFWGLGSIEGHWSTHDWLSAQASNAGDFDSAEAFGESIAEGLNHELRGFRFVRETDAGIGIHFTAYERFDGIQVPELFLISNWISTSYNELREAGVGCSRETFHTFFNVPSSSDHRQREFRLRVARRFNGGEVLQYNNGDPGLFNRAANGIMDMLAELRSRGIMQDPDDPATQRDIARAPVEVVADLQSTFCRPGTQRVGGRIRDLTVFPDGRYDSTTGDAP